jgi:hypothetical protein
MNKIALILGHIVAQLNAEVRFTSISNRTSLAIKCYTQS